jgi:hypothetical protein
MTTGNPMRLALSHYLRTLRERDEFDRLLPELLTEMGYIALVKPMAGVRQFGVDFPAAGKSLDDGVDELLLFVIKQGDINRRIWDGDPNAVRPSMDEIIDVYLASHVPSGYENHRKVIIVATTGDLGQAVQPNWAGYTSRHRQLRFEFWGADRVADLIEMHLLNEHLFDGQDRADLRKSLVMGADSGYRFEDLCRLMLRQLGLSTEGGLSDAGQHQTPAALVKALRRVHLAALVCSYWADAEGERRQALWVMERTVLWSFHRAVLQGLHQEADIQQAVRDIWESYREASRRYYQRIESHIRIKDGLSGYTREGSEYAMTLLEQVGLLASIGLSITMTDPATPDEIDQRALMANAMADLLRNHPAAASPRLDEQVVDVCLALVLLTRCGRFDTAKWWIAEIAGRLNFAFRIGRMFPIGTDSLDDMVELDVFGDDELTTRVKQYSWLLATIASWSVMLGLDEIYETLARSHAQSYPEVGSQLWHPPADWSTSWYFGPGHHERGSSEAPYSLPDRAQDLRNRIAKFNASGRLMWEETSPALQVGLWDIDFVACRHFRTPVPASMWYHLRDEPLLMDEPSTKDC